MHLKDADLDADICFDQPGGLKMATLIKTMLDVVPALRPIILVLKYFLVQRELNETYRGGIGSFMLQLMVIACMFGTLLDDSNEIVATDPVG